jgi:drug/metabolite transporter (DMT)-like permease
MMAGLAMVGVVFAWGLGPPISKLISAPALVAVFFRMWLSVPVLLAWLYATRHRLNRSLLRATAPAGCLFGLNMCCVFLAFHHASIATLSVMSALQPGLVLVVAGPFLGERPTAWHRRWTVVGIAGAVLVIVGAGSAVRSSPLGVALSAAAMVSFTAYFLWTRVARARSVAPIDAIEWMAGVTIFSALTVTPLALWSSPPSDFGLIAGLDWLWLAFAVLITGITGHVMMAWVLRHIEASKASLYVLSMNVVSVAAAWAIHDEPLTVVQLLGGAVVLGAVAAVISRPAERAVAA